MYGNRLVIPALLRKEVLECLHAAHQGVAGMKARAATCVYWPGISAEHIQPLDPVPHMQHNSTITSQTSPAPTTGSCLPF